MDIATYYNNKKVTIYHNGRHITITFHDYIKGDNNVLMVTILQNNVNVVLLDHNLDSEV